MFCTFLMCNYRTFLDLPLPLLQLFSYHSDHQVLLFFFLMRKDNSEGTLKAEHANVKCSFIIRCNLPELIHYVLLHKQLVFYCNRSPFWASPKSTSGHWIAMYFCLYSSLSLERACSFSRAHWSTMIWGMLSPQSILLCPNLYPFVFTCLQFL